MKIVREKTEWNLFQRVSDMEKQNQIMVCHVTSSVKKKSVRLSARGHDKDSYKYNTVAYLIRHFSACPEPARFLANEHTAWFSLGTKQVGIIIFS